MFPFQMQDEWFEPPRPGADSSGIIGAAAGALQGARCRPRRPIALAVPRPEPTSATLGRPATLGYRAHEHHTRRPPRPSDLHPRDRRQAIVEVGLIFLIFFIHGAWPVPEVNETHYLTKAKHYWNPSWCPGDLFLDSLDAHQVFYWTCGWLTRFLSLPATAWCGRRGRPGDCWPGPGGGSVLRWSRDPLRRPFGGAVGRRRPAGMHLAGEWMIGGFEAKGLAYVFVLLALAALVRGQWRAVWPLLGVASAFHVLVGGWSVLAAGVAWLAAGPAAASAWARPLLSLAVGLVLAVAGLDPGAAAELGRRSGELVSEANRIYVFNRLPHHLCLKRSRCHLCLSAYPAGRLW